MLPIRVYKRWVDDSAGDGFSPYPSQKLKADVLRHTFRASSNVCHIGDLLTTVTR
jgi:hypothetical protein